MPTINYVYCDSCVFLAYFNGESGRIQILDQLFDEIHKDPAQKLITSVVSLTEVAYVSTERTMSGRFRPDSEALERIEAFWNDKSLVEFVDVHEIIAREARSLLRWAATRAFGLKPADAIHLASAKTLGVAEFLTYDDLKKYEPTVGYSVVEPYTRNPQLPLFDENPE